MPTIKRLAASVALVLAGMPGVAFAADADVIQQAKDRDEIEHLAWRYTRAIDTFNADAYVAVFTPDGSFGATKGRDALYKMVDAFRHPPAPPAGATPATGGAPAGPPGLLHMETNHWIEFKDKDHALYHYYWLTIGKPAKQGEPTRVLAAGNGLDEVVRTSGQWLFKARNITAPND